MTNVLLDEYYGQTKGANILLSSDDFWVGAWLGSMLGRDDGGSDSGCCGCLACIIAIIGVIACFGGKFGIYLGGLWDLISGICSCDGEAIGEGCCTICCI